MIAEACGWSRERAALLPQSVPGYVLLRERGRGGMGVVYKAVREADRRLVALKTVLPTTAANPAQLAKFLREADILRRLHAAGIFTPPAEDSAGNPRSTEEPGS